MLYKETGSVCVFMWAFVAIVLCWYMSKRRYVFEASVYLVRCELANMCVFRMCFWALVCVYKVDERDLSPLASVSLFHLQPCFFRLRTRSKHFVPAFVVRVCVCVWLLALGGEIGKPFLHIKPKCEISWLLMCPQGFLIQAVFKRRPILRPVISRVRKCF